MKLLFPIVVTLSVAYSFTKIAQVILTFVINKIKAHTSGVIQIALFIAVLAATLIAGVQMGSFLRKIFYIIYRS